MYLFFSGGRLFERFSGTFFRGKETKETKGGNPNYRDTRFNSSELPAARPHTLMDNKGKLS